MDKHPKELSWRIRRENGEIIDERQYGEYKRGYGVYFESISVDDGATFYLELSDSRGDGICCGSGQGSVSLYLGDEAVTSKFLAYDDGDFGSAVSIQFTASPSGFIDIRDPDKSLDGLVTMKIKTDDYPGETSWTIVSQGGGKVFGSDFGELSESNTAVLVAVVLDPGQTYNIIIYDMGGDGMCCANGEGEVSVFYGASADASNMLLVTIDGKFFTQSVSTFVVKKLSISVSICLPRDATCQLEGRGSVLMGDIKLGDKVLVGGGIYEPVYSFGYYSPQATGELIQLITLTTSLTLSRDHMVFVEGGRSVPAATIKIGDNLELANGEVDGVTEIRTVVRQGVYAPFTTSGTIIVDGVKASSFIAFQGFSTLHVAGFNAHLSYQFLAHTFEAPHRFWCRYWSCESDQYTVEGVSLWVDGPHKAVRWYFDENSILLDTVALLIALGILGVLVYPVFAATSLLLACLIAVQKGGVAVSVKKTV